MQLITEQSHEIEIQSEGTGDKKQFYIEGIFAQAEKKNRNGRIYRKNVLEESVNKYVENYVKTRKAVGEMSHPQRLNVDFERATHLVTNLMFEGNDVIGKARVLTTPLGQVVRGLLESGVAVGVSTRGAGEIQMVEDVIYVKPGFQMTAIDVVSDPSAHDAWVDGIMEGVQWVQTADGEFVESLKSEIRKASSSQLNEAKMKAFSDFLNHIKQI